MTDDRTYFTKDNFDCIINELEIPIERSQLLASQIDHISTLQTKQIEQCQTTMNKSSKHLKDVENEIDELEKSFCIRLCCTSTIKKSSSKNASLHKSQRNKSKTNLLHVEKNVDSSNDRFQSLDENLQYLQYLNTLIDREIHDQLQTLNDLHNKVDIDMYKLVKANSKSKRLF